ncbi:MAG TPA: sigma-70 family RNA polymerase sigma factor [Puia sp.]|nr:sigma-70 family RNA polymerase sigma factor [Puia sp.]
MKQYELYDEAQLLFAFQAQDDVKAFEEIYKRSWLRLYSWAYTNTSSRQEAEEMVQVVFERLWKNRRKTKIRDMGAYLAVSLRNIFYDFQRRNAQLKKFRQSGMDAPVSNPTEEEVNRKLLLETVENALRVLPQKTQTIFRMSRYENTPVREIADRLHLTEKAVEYHITKALKLIRHRLKEYLPLLF